MCAAVEVSGSLVKLEGGLKQGEMEERSLIAGACCRHDKLHVSWAESTRLITKWDAAVEVIRRTLHMDFTEQGNS